MSKPRRFLFICAFSIITMVIMLLYLYMHTSTTQSLSSLTQSSLLHIGSGSARLESTHFTKEHPSRSKTLTTVIRGVTATQEIQELTNKQPLKHLHAHPVIDKNTENESAAQIVYKSFQLKQKQSPLTNKSLRVVTFSEKGKFQRQQVDKFCDRYNLRTLPPPNIATRTNFYKRLLHNDKAETIFCIVPKVGSTSLVVLYFIAQGLLPESRATVKRGLIPNSELQQLVDHHSLAAMTDEERLRALNKYYKFVMYRNPLERLVSGYKSKVKNYPLQGLEDAEPHYNWLRHNIYQKTHPVRYQEWRKKGGKEPIHIPFLDFIKFWLYNGKGSNDPHFRPIFDLCEPCRVRYSYYGNFDTFQDDAQVLMNKIGATSNQLRQGYYGDKKNTTSFVESFYAELTVEQKRDVLKKLSQDLDFYYHIFPSEVGVHKRLLQLDDELTVP